MAAPRQQRRRRRSAPRWRRLLLEIFEPRLALAAPLAANDAFGGLEDTPLTISAPGVIANDTDLDGDPLLVVLAGQAIRGSVSLNANGGFHYTPNANLFGLDSFTYTLRDATGLNGNTASVTISVAGVNDPPVAVNDSYLTLEDTPLTIFAPGVLANDADVEGFPSLTAEIVSFPAHGTLTLLPSGGFQYVPAGTGPCAAPFIGPDSFTYRARDQELASNPATVTISITPLGEPPAPFGIPIATQEDFPVTREAPGLLSITVPAGPCAPPGTPPAVFSYFGPATLISPPRNGMMTVQPDGRFTYVPSANSHGNDDFTFRAFDAQQQPVHVFATMVVAPVNDPPQATPDLYQVREDEPLVVPAAMGVLANDFDVDGNKLSAQIVVPPAHGTLWADGAPLPPWPTLFNGGFTYFPYANFNGTDSFSYRASDGLTGSSFAAVVTINVLPVNDIPVAINDTYSAIEDSSLVSSPLGILGNDFDSDFPSVLSAVLVAGPAGGSFSLNSNGTFTYTPAANFNGPASFTYRARDLEGAESAPATATINVASVNDPPVANNDLYTGVEDIEFQVGPGVGVLINDVDVDSASIAAVLGAPPGHGTISLFADGGFRYVPNRDFFGADSFTYRASDGISSSNAAIVSIFIEPPPSPPIAIGDAFSAGEDVPLAVTAPGVLANDSDIEGDPLTAILAGQPLHGAVSLALNGGFIYTPSANYIGLDSFTYRARDHHGFDSNLATVVITVHRSPEPPMAASDSFDGTEDLQLAVGAPGILANDMEDSLTAMLMTATAHGTINLQPTGAFLYTPQPNFFGKDSFTYRATDGSASTNIATVTLNIAGVNDPPVAIQDSYSTTMESPRVISAPGVLANDLDADLDTLIAILATGPVEGTLALNPDGSFVYTPATCFIGNASFTYRVSDGSSTSASAATVTIAVSGLGAPPSGALPDSFTVNEDAPLTIAAPGILANDGDRCSGPLTAEIVSAPLRGTLSLNPNGGFDYTPSANFNGTDSFSYRARDGFLFSNTALVTIDVRPVNDPPVFTIDPRQDFVFDDDAGPQRVEHFLTNRSAGPSEQGQVLSLSVSTDRQDLFAQQPVVDGTGALIFTPARNVRGVAQISVVLMDDGGTAGGGVDASVTQTFTIAIQKPHPWHNTVVLAFPLLGALDVNQDGSISPIDAVLVINFLNSEQTKLVPLNGSIGGPNGMGAATAFIDTGGGVDGRGDNFVSPIDAILVINWLNANASARSTSSAGSASAVSEGEGERSESRAADASNLWAIDSMMEALAMEAVSKAKRDELGVSSTACR